MNGEAMKYEQRCAHGMLRSQLRCEPCDRAETRAKRLDKPFLDVVVAVAESVETPVISIRSQPMPAIPLRRPDVGETVRCVAESYLLSTTRLLSKDRHKSVAEARGVLCWLLRMLTGMSFPEIGRELGNRDHTTVMSAVKKCVRRRALEPGFLTFTDELQAAVAARVGGAT